MKLILLLLALVLIISVPAHAAVVVVPGTSAFYCPVCPTCAYYGQPCSVPYYDNPNAMFSYDQYYHYGAYNNLAGAVEISPYSQFPPYLGVDASRQWFASPSH